MFERGTYMLTLAQAGGAGAALLSFLPMLIIFVGMFWWMNHSQKKQQQQRNNFLDSIHVGDHVTTIGGLHGVVSELNKEKKIVTIDCDGIYLDFDLTAIKNAVGKQDNSQN